MEHPNLTEAAKNWINGSWNNGGTIRQAVSPSTGQPLGNYLDIGADEARQAIEAARTAFDTTNWSKNAPCARVPCLSWPMRSKNGWTR